MPERPKVADCYWAGHLRWDQAADSSDVVDAEVIAGEFVVGGEQPTMRMLLLLALNNR